jgi:hypothetical protein
MIVGLQASKETLGCPLQPKRTSYFYVDSNNKSLSACLDILGWSKVPKIVIVNEVSGEWMITMVQNVMLRNEIQS